jgi:hypothetical protein
MIQRERNIKRERKISSNTFSASLAKQYSQRRRMQSLRKKRGILSVSV